MRFSIWLSLTFLFFSSLFSLSSRLASRPLESGASFFLYQPES